MAPGFSFPPPPPPPPKSSAPAYSPSADRGRGRGGRGHSRGRGGSFGGRGANATPITHLSPSPSLSTNQYPAGSYVNHNFAHGTINGDYSQPQRTQSHGSSLSHGQKRKLDDVRSDSWRGGRGRGQEGRPRPMKQQITTQKTAIAPSVPSFGLPLPFPIGTSTGPVARNQQASHGSTSSNTLGLTPTEGSLSVQVGSDSEESDDEDEEAAYGKVVGEKLKFEHNGEIITLETQADIMAWIQERKAGFATKHNIEQKLHARHARMEERRRIEQESADMLNSSKSGKQPTHKALSTSQVSAQKANTGPSNRADLLRKQLMEQKLSRQKEQEANSVPTPATEAAKNIDTGSEDGTPSDQSLSSEDDSDSDVSNDSAPEEQTSKTTPASRELATPPTARQPCHYFQTRGLCRYGRNCHFEHVRDESMTAKQKKQKKQKENGSERKTLHQRLLEQQQDEEDKLALQAIRYLGNMGLLRPIETATTGGPILNAKHQSAE
ncbi:hypothetical protein BDZ85DRAFT_316085 [Elsinoe ampelina]|uniref:C3H1-type domain-containing protein n=1 Tax=Elsinoe ampelina TaxID=302913 RepID=A0A6A6GLF4_9PEZI|nr:hypothetical protein BDZ85DRAFT_316085 [Elsinoe ampelina]